MREDSLTYRQSNDTVKIEELYFDKYFSKKFSSTVPLFSNDSTVTTLSRPELKHERISRQPETFDWIFGIFLISFIFFSSIIGKRTQIISSTISELFVVKGRKSIFSEPTQNEWYSKLFLCFQTCLLLAIFLCRYFAYNSNTVFDSPVKSIIFILSLTVILCIFFILKWAAYYMVGLVFFDKSSLQTWIGNFFSLLAFSGVFLFIPTLFYFYVDSLHNFFFYFIVIYLILFEILIIYKSIVLFFYKQNRLLHLFLYLCGQEIVPLFFLWKIVVYMFNFVEKNILWL